MTTPNQIAERAASPTHGWDNYRVRQQRIQSAIEEATAELQKANDNLFKVARKHSVENQELKKSREYPSERQVVHSSLEHSADQVLTPSELPAGYYHPHSKPAATEQGADTKRLEWWFKHDGIGFYDRAGIDAAMRREET